MKAAIGNGDNAHQYTARGRQGRSSPNPKPKHTSALDAAAKVLADAGEPMTTKQMIEAMAAKGLWTSPEKQARGLTSTPAKLV